MKPVCELVVNKEYIYIYTYLIFHTPHGFRNLYYMVLYYISCIDHALIILRSVQEIEEEKNLLVQNNFVQSW